MPKEVTNPITAHQVTWMDSEFGWVRLLNGAKDAGYIYFIPDSSPLKVPALNSDGSYIIFSVHLSHLGLLLSILRDEKPLQIRFFDPEAGGVAPSAFIEPVSGLVDSAKVAHAFEKLRNVTDRR